MSRVIHKYDVPVGYLGNHVVSMPKGAEILRVANQGDTQRIWAIVDLTKKYVDRTFWWAATGFTQIPDCNIYIGTIDTKDGYVFHLFEVKKC